MLGDRSLKYKYVNPNLLLVATSVGEGGAPSHGAASAASEEAAVAVTLLNTVTGAVVHHAVHQEAAGPVHAVLSEHWAVYTLWDTAALRQQVRGSRRCAGASSMCGLLLRACVCVSTTCVAAARAASRSCHSLLLVLLARRRATPCARARACGCLRR